MLSAPPSSAAPAGEVSSVPAAGDLVWPSVRARTRPSPRAKVVTTLRQMRPDLFPQIVLADAMRRIGVVAPRTARASVRTEAGDVALEVSARSAGAPGNSLRLTVREHAHDSTLEELAVEDALRRLGTEVFVFPDGDVAALVDVVNTTSDLIRAEAVGEGALARVAGVRLAGGRNANPGRLWYRLNLPIRPFGTRGWVPAESVDVRPTTTEIVVRRRARVLEVVRRGRTILRTRVAVGRPGRPTPLGNFYVESKFVPTRTALVSTYALELSAPANLPDFPGGNVGIHGTPQLWSIGRAASNGCIRVHPAVARRIGRLVPLGTPVRILP